MADNTDQSMGSAVAGGAIATAILEFLFDKKTITIDESRAILDKAMRNLVVNSPGGHEAIQIIGALQRGKYSARG